MDPRFINSVHYNIATYRRGCRCDDCCEAKRIEDLADRYMNEVPVDNWADQAACKGMDPNIFFAEDESVAKKVCQSCPVVISCLSQYIGKDIDGIFGGTNYKDRRRIYKLTRSRRMAQVG